MSVKEGNPPIIFLETFYRPLISILRLIPVILVVEVF